MKALIALLVSIIPFVLFNTGWAYQITGYKSSKYEVDRDWDSKIDNGDTTTIFDATQSVFPKGDTDDDYEFVIAQEKVLRKPTTSKERSILPSGTRLEIPSVLKIKSLGKQYNVLLWEATVPEDSPDYSTDGGFTIVGIFPKGSAGPTDVTEVKTDKFTFFGENFLLKIGNDDAFTIINHHADAGMPYYSTSLFQIRDGRLRRIAEISTLGQMDGCSKSFREDINWSTESDGGNNYPKIIATVELIHAPKEYQEGCEKKASEKKEKFQDIYIWDDTKSRYIRLGGNIDLLDHWNENQM